MRHVPSSIFGPKHMTLQCRFKSFKRSTFFKIASQSYELLGNVISNFGKFISQPSKRMLFFQVYVKEIIDDGHSLDKI
jgi:hypothetical protein